MLKFKCLEIIALTVIALCFSSITNAVPIFQVRSISLTTSGPSGAQPPVSDVLSFDAFDPTLGILDSVSINLDAALTTVIQTGTNFTPPGIPIPYPNTGHAIFDIGALSPIAFLIPATSTHPFIATGVGETRSFIDSISINIVFDQTTDLVSGVATGSGGNTIGPAFVEGLTSSFLKTPITEAHGGIQFSPILSGNYFMPSIMPGTTSLFFDGLMTIQYDYTPKSSSAIPEPTTIALLILGIAGIGFSRKRVSNS